MGNLGPKLTDRFSVVVPVQHGLLAAGRERGARVRGGGLDRGGAPLRVYPLPGSGIGGECRGETDSRPGRREPTRIQGTNRAQFDKNVLNMYTEQCRHTCMNLSYKITRYKKMKWR